MHLPAADVQYVMSLCLYADRVPFIPVFGTVAPIALNACNCVVNGMHLRPILKEITADKDC